MTLNKKLILTIFVFLLFISVPYLYAISVAPEGYSFAGFFANYHDGHSYLGKMKQGFEGRWVYNLIYSPEISSGAFMMVPYLFLGHVARLLGGNFLFWLHSARLITSTILALSLYYFMSSIFPLDEKMRWRAYLFSLFGSGLGWLALLAGEFPMDFWVAEAYPFLSSYTNVHFPLGLALQLWLLRPNESKPNRQEAAWLVLGSAGLGLISAFSIPVVLAVWGGVFLLRWLKKENPWPIFWRGFWVGLGGLPIIFYDYFVILNDPVLAGWNAQNITTTPPLWDMLLSFSPVLLVAIPGLYFAWRRNQLFDQMLISWIVTCFLLAISPFPLQRRFLIGYSIPLVALALKGLQSLIKPSRQQLVWFALFLFALPTNMILLTSSVVGANSLASELYITESEIDAFSWIEEHISLDSVIAAAPQTGVFLPTYGVRVIYGHPFESLDAEVREQWVLDFFAGEIDKMQALDFFDKLNVEYVFVGPRELELGQVDWLDQLTLIYSVGEVKIYAVNP